MDLSREERIERSRHERNMKVLDAIAWFVTGMAFYRTFFC
jgi:hypothetical protein